MNSAIASDTRVMRGINAAAVLAAVRTADAPRVASLARDTGLSRQAVARAIGVLEAAQLVELSAPEPLAAGSGRPAQRVRFRAEAGCVLGIALSPSDVRLSLADLAGDELCRLRLPIDPASVSVDVVAVLLRGIDEILPSASVSIDRVWGVVVGAPGIIDPATGRITRVPSMEAVRGDMVVDALRARFACEVVVDNDVKLATEGQQWRTPHDVSSLVRIEWGERLGAGIVLNGALHRGASNDAGDVGFLELPMTQAEAESVAGHGAFETWVGAAELIRLAREYATGAGDRELETRLDGLDAGAAFEAVIASVREQRPAAVRAVAEISRRLAVGLAAIRAILDPELIVIGGPMARCGEVILSEVTAALAQSPLNQPRVELCGLGADAVLIGAIHRGLDGVQRQRLSAIALGGHS